MLNINPEIVCEIIAKSREFFAKEEVVLPNEPEEKDLTDDWYYAVLADFQEDLTFREVQSNIRDLEPDQQISLVVLCWIGRGDYGPEDWNEAYAEAKRSWSRNIPEYLLSKPLLPSYLEEGLNQLGYSCE